MRKYYLKCRDISHTIFTIPTTTRRTKKLFKLLFKNKITYLHYPKNTDKMQNRNLKESITFKL